MTLAFLGIGLTSPAIPEYIASREREIERIALEADEEKQRVEQRKYALKLLNSMLFVFLGNARTESDIRITVFSACERPDHLTAIARHTCDGSVDYSREIHVSQGIAGRCYRSGKWKKIDGITDHGKFAISMGFTAEDAKGLTSDRQSFLCLPIRLKSAKANGGKIVGVMSLDARSKGVLTKAHALAALAVLPQYAEIIHASSRSTRGKNV